MGDLGLIPGLRRSPGEGNGYPLQYSCLENPHGQRSLAGYGPWGHKELDMTEQLIWYPNRAFLVVQIMKKICLQCRRPQFHPIPGLGSSPGEGNGTHPSILVWRIPWTEKTGSLQSMGLQKSDWTEQLTHTQTTITTISFRTFSSPQKEIPYPVNPQSSHRQYYLKKPLVYFLSL